MCGYVGMEMNHCRSESTVTHDSETAAPESIQVVTDRHVGLVAIGCGRPAGEGLEEGAPCVRIQWVLSSVLVCIPPAAGHLLMLLHPATATGCDRASYIARSVLNPSATFDGVCPMKCVHSTRKA